VTWTKNEVLHVDYARADLDGRRRWLSARVYGRGESWGFHVAAEGVGQLNSGASYSSPERAQGAADHALDLLEQLQRIAYSDEVEEPT
jgi:hypothetical protein